MRTIADFTTMLGCRVQLTEFLHEDIECYRLSLDVDSRHAEVLLSNTDITTLVRRIREYDEQ